jgi:YHS domain-containing protein
MESTSHRRWKLEREATYYFCSKGCMEDFAEEPTAYLG